MRHAFTFSSRGKRVQRLAPAIHLNINIIYLEQGKTDYIKTVIKLIAAIQLYYIKFYVDSDLWLAWLRKDSSLEVFCAKEKDNVY